MRGGADATGRGRSWIRVALLVLIALTGLGAIPAGIGFLTDPSGGSLGMSPDMLLRGPFNDYLVPGLFLLIVLGLGALAPVWSLWTRAPWGATAGFGYGAILLVWITAQAWVIGVTSPLQPVFGTVGLLMIALALGARQEYGTGGEPDRV